MYNFSSTLLFLILTKTIFSQGCSDAGVCTSGSHGSNEDSASTSISIGQSFEVGEEFTLITSSYFRLQFLISSKASFTIRTKYTSAFGKLGNTTGLGDVLGSFTLKLIEKNQYKIYTNFGGKIPTNSSNKTNNQGLPLPMPYQSSLGTYDILMGGSVYFSKWRYSFGYQHVFNANKNGFLHETWQNNNFSDNYYESNFFKRGDDLMFRIERIFKKEKSVFSVSFLPIYRFQKDQIWKNNQYLKLNGSNQLTINLNLVVTRNISKKLSTRFSFANPVLWRKTRADGLTRFFVFYAGIKYLI